MNRGLITILTVLAVTGLTGLTVVQIIWLRNAIAVKEQRFDNSVREALYEIADRIQEFEYQPFVRDLIVKNTRGGSNTGEAEIFISSGEPQSPGGPQQLYVHLDDYFDTTIAIATANSPDDWTQATDPSAEVSTWSLNFDIGELPVSVMVDPYEFAEKFLAQRRAVNELILKQLFSLQPITEVIDTGRLSEIISQTLESKGVRTKFNFGITEYTPNNFVYVSTGSSLAQLYSTGYTVDLFPRSVFESTKQLALVFPDRQAYLLRALWIPLGSSAVFLLLVIGTFALAIYIILRQKQLSEMKTDFINNMTHELKTPISTISLASQMLRDESISANASSRLKYAGVIYDENKRLGNQVDKVLQIARMEKGEIKYNMTPVDVHDLIAVILHQFSIQVDDAGGRLVSRLEAATHVIDADEMHLTNVLNNLLDNALKYNDKDEPLIEVATSNHQGMLTVEVRDNGMGMKKEELKRIFDKFYRVNKGDIHNTKGFGIGLSYVKTIVAAHKGSIDVQSQPGSGTVFTVHLPIKQT